MWTLYGLVSYCFKDVSKFQGLTAHRGFPTSTETKDIGFLGHYDAGLIEFDVFRLCVVVLGLHLDSLSA